MSDVLGAPALDALTRVVGTGALVSLGLSRDGGALAATVTLDGDWLREWHRDCDELTAWLLAVVDAIEAHSSVPPSASQDRANGRQMPSVRGRGPRKRD